LIKNLFSKLLNKPQIKASSTATQTNLESRRDQLFANQHEQKKQDRFMAKIYRMVTTHRDGEAVYTLMQQYDYFHTEVAQYEELFRHIHGWGPSRTLLCIGRLVIQRLHEEKRYGRALYFIEQCQAIRPQFILPDLSQTLFYARQAIELGKIQLALNLLQDPYTRYGDEVNAELCIELLAQIS
jgi:hypothetical protein